jgi:hypothetical protein
MAGASKPSEPADAERPVRLALALSEASRRIERTELWEQYTEALHRADSAEARYLQMQNVMRTSRADRAEIRRLKAEATKKLAEVEALIADKLAKSPGEVLAEKLHAERLAWSEKRREYARIMDEYTLSERWARVRSGGSDVY